MIKIKNKGLKTIKSLHIIGIIFWIGGLIYAIGLLMISKSVPNQESLIYLFYLMEFIDNYFIISGALATVLIGIIYGIFTNWGFLKFRWIIVKWILSWVIIIVGSMIYLPTVENMKELVYQYGLSAMQNASYQGFYAKFLLSLLSSMMMAIIMVLMSTFRPKLILKLQGKQNVR